MRRLTAALIAFHLWLLDGCGCELLSNAATWPRAVFGMYAHCGRRARSTSCCLRFCGVVVRPQPTCPHADSTTCTHHKRKLVCLCTPRWLLWCFVRLCVVPAVWTQWDRFCWAVVCDARRGVVVAKSSPRQRAVQ
jgi:hypothetical protein